MHPEYFKRHNNADIAILRLDKTVPHLTGLKPYYTFRSDLEKDINLDKHKFNDPLLRQLFYVGYGMSGNDSDYFKSPPDGKRRASFSLLHFFSKDQDNIERNIYSIPTKSGFNFEDAGIVVLNQREQIPFEMGIRPGMSGGATLNRNLSLVGINQSTEYQHTSHLDKTKIKTDKFTEKYSMPIKTGAYSFYLYTLLNKKRVFLNIGCGLTIMTLTNLRIRKSYPGTRCISTSIEPHKKWIEEWRKRFQQEY